MESKSAAMVVKAYFNMTIKEMKEEWLKLSEEDKIQIASGIVNGSLSY